MIILLLAFDRAHGAGRPRPIAVSSFFGALFPKRCFETWIRDPRRTEAFNESGMGLFSSHILQEPGQRSDMRPLIR